MPSKTVDELCQAIEAAFAEAEYPGDENIVTHWSGQYTDIEEVWVRESFTGRHWKTVPLESVIFNRDHLPHFTPEAFRFFLPTFLLAVLQHPVEVDVLSNNLFYELTPDDPEGPSYSPFFDERVNGLTPAQKDVVRKFINWYLDEFITQEWKTLVPNPAWERASRYWNNT